MQSLVQTVSFKRLTEEKLEDLGWSQKDLQQALGLPERTYYRRLKAPGSMTINQMRRWAEVLHFTQKEKLDMIEKILK